MKKILLWLLVTGSLFAQKENPSYTKADFLRGSITPEREWWDLNFYHLDIEVEPDKKYISGKNTVRYKVLKPEQVMQIDLQPPMKIEKVLSEGKELSFKSSGNVHLILLDKKQEKGDFNEIEIYYSGNPKEAVRAPWDGGFSWKKDTNGNDFIATSCQGLGASVWWPNKDHMYDEVDSMAISVTAPKDLMDVSNGRLRSVEDNGDTKTYHWFVNNPINNYGVNVNLGDYVHFGEKYQGEKGELDLDYYVLRDNLEKAKEQFKQTAMMMKAFEHWFGPYPFYDDGFKLVEVPYLGMEHQSSVTYGNQYQNGYLGNDLSGTGWGLKFDFIIIHEAGHEWFANNITYKDIADMWIHEGFTAYSENLYLDYHFGKEAAADYVIGTRANIRNDKPIIGRYNLNKRGSGDMYYKGANILHTLRQLIEDDEKWRQILRGLNEEFYYQTVTTKQIEDYISKETKKDLSAFFEQYLRTTDIPTLEYKLDGKSIKYRYKNVVDDFDMPVRILVGNEEKWLFPEKKQAWKTEDLKTDNIVIDRNFYIEASKL
ncbi:M1 family metallopeptidase [Croceitalea sp. MTPC9]|uniref:M1 family metallopeptidase n=1 Tax=unclassified Croceitalea TaxID=2632280 RepID=UPI002B3E709B|nr:M1 family metallopeptidase [Croceitalea sp. MTPC6]GMN15363.1 M1 family metallopeptidase [Croceitalea sp. MTPC9]